MNTAAEETRRAKLDLGALPAGERPAAFLETVRFLSAEGAALVNDHHPMVDCFRRVVERRILGRARAKTALHLELERVEERCRMP